MNWLFQTSWLAKSLITMLWVTPAWLMIGFANKNLGMKPELTFVWYTLGMLIGGPFLLQYLNIPLTALKPSLAALLVVIVGIVFGAVANMLLFGAVGSAPNAGVPIVIVNASSILVFVLAVLLAFLLPKYFAESRFDIYHLLGIVLVIMGIGIISLHK